MTLRRHLSVGLPLLTALLGGCTHRDQALVESPDPPRAELRTEEGPAERERPVSIGSVNGHALEARSAVLLWREEANDAQLVISGSPDLCATLGDGAWPPGATVLMVGLKQNDRASEDDSWGPGEYPVRGEGPRQPRDIDQALFMTLSARCEPTTRALATSGSVRLTGAAVGPGSMVEGELDLAFGEDRLQGRFVATVCQMPEVEPRGCR